MELLRLSLNTMHMCASILREVSEDPSIVLNFPRDYYIAALFVRLGRYEETTKKYCWPTFYEWLKVGNFRAIEDQIAVMMREIGAKV